MARTKKGRFTVRKGKGKGKGKGKQRALLTVKRVT